MKDRNGREIRTGDVVRISNAYFKNDNGLYYVDRSPGDPSWLGNDYSLRKIRRDGTFSVAKYSVAFWPLTAFCSNREKNLMAREWNKEHAEIEIIDTVDRTTIRNHFLEEAEQITQGLERKGWDYGKHSACYLLDARIHRHYLNVAESIK